MRRVGDFRQKPRQEPPVGVTGGATGGPLAWDSPLSGPTDHLCASSRVSLTREPLAITMRFALDSRTRVEYLSGEYRSSRPARSCEMAPPCDAISIRFPACLLAISLTAFTMRSVTSLSVSPPPGTLSSPPGCFCFQSFKLCFG